MTWHTEIVDAEHFQRLLDTVRRTGGTVTNSRPCAAGYSVTYVTLEVLIDGYGVEDRS
jgi:hypothetical protein